MKKVISHNYDKIIFFDIDGTLYDSINKIVHKKTLKALSKLREAGYLLCIATGRNIDNFPSPIYNFNWDGYVCNNGLTIYLKDKSILYENFFPNTVINKILTEAEAYNIPLEIKSYNHKFLIPPINDYVKCAFNYFNVDLPLIEKYKGQKVNAILSFGTAEYLKSHLGKINEIAILPGMNTFADITLKEHSKRTGIYRLLDHYGLKRYIAFGDSYNDMDMISHASLGISMGNSPIDLVKQSDYTTLSVSDNGIFYACNELNLWNNM